MFQKFLSACFEVFDFLFQHESWGKLGPIVTLFKVHEGLPCDTKIKVRQRRKGLFEDVPVGFECLVTIHRWILRAFIHDPNDTWITMKDSNGRKLNCHGKGQW